jgi:hypothetical protein
MLGNTWVRSYIGNGVGSDSLYICIPKCFPAFFWDSLFLEDGTDKLLQIVGNKLPLYAA